MSEKVIGFLKRNYLLIIAYLIPIIVIAISFKTYYSEYYSPKQYQEYEKQCELTKNEEICSNKELLKQENDKFIKTDAKTHYFEVTYHYIINYITILAPLIVILQTISKLHCEFSSGFIKNTLTRMSYKDYLKKIYLTSLKSALILPAIIIVTLLFALTLGVSFLGRKYVFSKVRINKFIPLAIAIILLVIQMFLPNIVSWGSNIIVVITMTILTVTFFMWFLEIQATGGPKKKEKEIVIRPKAKPNRVKHLNKDAK